MRQKDVRMRALATVLIVMGLISAGFISIRFSDNVEAAFVNSFSVPWDSNFIPNDSVWDPSGSYCMVVGNDTAATSESNAWAYSSLGGEIWTRANATTGGATVPTSHTFFVGSGVGNYSATIQPAIDAANSGDTVFVWAGVYTSQLSVSKTINLTGQDRATTIINGVGTGDVVSISSDWVNMTGFTVQNSGAGFLGIFLDIVDNCRISNNIVDSNGYGIYVYYSNGNTISNNRFVSNINNGIYVTDSANNVIEKNNVTSNPGNGIVINWSNSNIVRNNDVISNLNIGIYMFSSNSNSVYNNNIRNNVGSQGSDNTGTNAWNLDKNQGGGNHWSDWTTPDGGDGFVTISRPIAGGGAVDQFPWVMEDGWVGEIVVDKTGGVNRRVNDDATMSMQRASSMAIGTDGTIYIAWEDTRSGDSDIYFAKSTDGGQSFGANVRVNNIIASTQSFASLAVDALTGNIYIAWEDFSSGNLDIYFSRSIDGGLTFVNSIRINTDGGTTIQAGPSVAVGPDGTVYVAWSDYRNIDSDIYFAKSTNNGLSFGLNIRVDSAPGGSDQQRPSVAAYSTNVYFVWNDIRSGNLDIYFRMSTDRGSTFGAEKILNNDGVGANQYFPDIAIGPEGNIYVAWQDTRNGNFDIYFTRSTDNGVNFISNTRLDNDGAATEQIRTSVAIGPPGNVYVAWEDARDGTLNRHIYFARSTNSGTTFETNKKFTSDPGSKTQPSLAIHPTGKIFCAWGDNRLDTSDVFFAMYVEFSSIQPAINAARPMWTVRVIPATYTERLNINKRLTLTGNNKTTTIVNAGGISNVINVTADNVNINTLTLANANPTGGDGIKVLSVGNCTFSNLIITTASWGIEMLSSQGFNLIEHCSITTAGAISIENSVNFNRIQNNNCQGSASGSGIYILSSSDNQVHNNTIIGFYDGVYFESTANGNTFTENRFEGNVNGAWVDGGTGNTFYHNNFISNTLHANGDGIWNFALPSGGNYWDDWTTPDDDGNGIVDSPKTFTGGQDNFPWTVEDGWLNYTENGTDSFEALTGTTWDAMNGRFLLCGISGGASSVYYVLPHAIDVKVPIPGTPSNSFFAIASDSLGNILVGGNDLPGLYYYDNNGDTGWYTVTESGTGSMEGWNVTGITFNSNDGRFYIVGNIKNQNNAVAFYTDVASLAWVGAQCYLDTSTFIGLPGTGSLSSIEWNPTHNYALAVGSGVYRLDQYNGSGSGLTWTVIQAPGNDNYYLDVSWDSDGWNEAGIVGRNQTYGNYWRYYDSNPQLIRGYRDPSSGTKYRTCAFKPPSSPKWVLIPTPDGGIQINIQEKDESGEITVDVVSPTLDWIGFNESFSPYNSMLDTSVHADTTYLFTLQANYSNGWSNCEVIVQAWHDGGLMGTEGSSYPAETDGNRNLAFTLTWTVGDPDAVVAYPTAPEMEITTGAVTDDDLGYPNAIGDPQNHHAIQIPVWLGNQVRAGDGGGFVFRDPAYGPDKNATLIHPDSWDFNITVRDSTQVTAYATSYGEFGVNLYASIDVSGNPGGSIPPGATAELTSPSYISYSINSAYTLNVSIPNLLKDGNPALNITADNVQVNNTHVNADVSNSEMAIWTAFSSPGTDICIWGLTGVSVQPVGNGTISAGPDYSNFTAFGAFEVTEVWWMVTVPVGTAEGTYRSVITITLWS